MDKLTHQMRLAQWVPIIRECRNSGMTVKAWCTQNDIGEKQFYYWQRRVRKEAFAELQELPDDSSKKLVELPISSAPASNHTADIVIRHGAYTLEICNSASPGLLESLLKVVAHVK